MDLKSELMERLCAEFPGNDDKIRDILAGYSICRESEQMRSNLKKRVQSFLAAKKIDGLSAKTLKNYRDMLGQFITQVDKHVSRITTDDIRGYIGFLAERGLKDSSVQTHINCLRSFFSWLDVEDIIRKNPMRKIKSLKFDRMRSRRPLNPEELEQLRDGCQTYKQKALIEFLVSSGCRLGEIVGLRVDQVDWQSRSVVVTGKGDKDRTVYFSVRAKMMLKAYLAQRKGGHALFASSRTPYDAMGAAAIQKLVRQIGVQAHEPRRIHPHILRHTFASNAVNGGMKIATIQQLLGHSDPKTTCIYAEMSPKAVQYEYEQIIA